MKQFLLLLILAISFNSFAQDVSNEEIGQEQELIERELETTDPNSSDFEALKAKYLSLDSKRARRKYRRQFDRETKRKLRRSTKKWPGPTLVCVYAHAESVVQVMSLRCNNFRNQKYQISMVGLGAGVGVGTGVAIVKTKNDDIEGSYSFANGAFYLGVGITSGEHIKTSNPEAKPQFIINGLGIGLGYDASLSKVVIEKL